MTSSHCAICTKKLRKNQRVLPCSTCGCKIHLKCSHVTPNQFNTLQSSNFDCFVCKKCSPTSNNPKHVLNYLSSLKERDSYHSIKHLNEKLNLESKGDLFVLHFNIVSLVLHKDAITSMISRTKVKPEFVSLNLSYKTKKLNGRKN